MGTRTLDSAFRTLLSRLTPTTAEVEAGASHRQSLRDCLEARFGVYRFFETGSFSHGTGVRYFSDTDMIVSLKTSQQASSLPILVTIRDLLSIRYPSTRIYVSRPTVRVEFGGGYETWEIVPAFIRGKSPITGEPVYSIPSASNDGWILSSPESHLKYVNDSNVSPEYGAAKALARLAKAWKYYNSVPVSSFYLEMQAAYYMRSESSFLPSLDFMYYLRHLQRIKLGDMQDPTGDTGWIKATSSASAREEALRHLDSAVFHANQMAEAGDTTLGFVWADLLFDHKFPSQYF